MATEKRYSLVDIFKILKQVNHIYENKKVTVISESFGEDEETIMSKSEYIAMNIAYELVTDESLLASEQFTAKQKDVEEAMKQAGFDKVAYPRYDKYLLDKSHKYVNNTN